MFKLMKNNMIIEPSVNINFLDLDFLAISPACSAVKCLFSIAFSFKVKYLK